MHCYVIRNVHYCNPVHVSSSTVLIVGRSNCINTVSGIVFCINDFPVCRLRRNRHTGQSLIQNNVPDAVLIQFDFLMMSTVLLETCRGKGKAVPSQRWTGPEGCRKLRFPDCMTMGQMVVRLSALRTGRLYPQ